MIEGPEFYLEKSENPEFCLENIQFKHFHPNFATIPPIILESKNLQMFQFPRFPENHLSNCLALQDLVRFVHQYLLLPTAPPNGSSTAPSVQSPGS